MCRLFRFDRLSIINRFSRFPVSRVQLPRYRYVADLRDHVKLVQCSLHWLPIHQRNTTHAVYSYVWCRSRVCIRLHHQSGYTDISYIGPVTSSLCRQLHDHRHPSDADKDGRSCWSGYAPGTHFWLTFVVHPAWTLLRSVSIHICFLLLTSYNNFFYI